MHWKTIFILFSSKTYVVGSQKNHPFEHPKPMLNMGEKNNTNFTLIKFPYMELWIIVALWKLKQKP